MRYIRQLDAVRAIAVLLVIISHWLPETHLVNRITRGYNGSFGVTIFFVLSGFLITSILLQNKLQANNLALNKGALLKNFFFRRALRIFPIYYITVTLLLLFHKYAGTHITNTYPYYYTYTANLNFHFTQEWDSILSHLWSLSVEEQFYLIWPWVILFSPSKYLRPIIYFFILVGVISNYIFSTSLMDCFTTSCFDAFGLGALLSWQLIYRQQDLTGFYKATRITGIIAMGFIIFCLVSNKFILPFRTMASCIALWGITFVVLKEKTKTIYNTVLKNKVLAWLGKVSYGLYLYHLPVPYFFKKVLNKIKAVGYVRIPAKYYDTLLLLGSLVILLSLAWLSWTIIEKPFLNLKKHFETKKNATAAVEYVS